MSVQALSEPLSPHTAPPPAPPPPPPANPIYNKISLEERPRTCHGSQTSIEVKPKTAQRSTSTFSLVIASLYLGTFLVALDTTIIGTAIPAITTTFHALDIIAWFGTSYLLTLTALQPIFGKLYKVWDTKVLYLVCIGIFEVGSVLCAAAPSSTCFIIGRAIAGCGAAGLMQGSFAIVTRTVPLAKRPMYFGLFVSAFGVSIGVGPVLGGTLADRGIWRWCFWLNVPLGVIVTLLVSIFLKLDKSHGTSTRLKGSIKEFLYRLDLVGSTTMIASVCCLFIAMQYGGQHLPWSSPPIISLFVVAGVLFALFLYVEWRMGLEATVPFSVLKQRSIASGAVYLFIFSMPNFAYGVYIPFFFQAIKGFTAQRSGAEILYLSLTQIIVVVVAGALVSRFGYYTPFIIGGTAVSVVGSSLITLLHLGTAHGRWIAHFIICGFGTGCAINLPYTAVSTVLKEEDMVTGNALMQFAFQLGGAVSLCISQTIFLTRLTVEVHARVPDISVDKVIKAGAHDFPRLTSSTAQLQALRVAYQCATRGVFVFLAATAGLAFLVSFGFEHKNVRKVERESALLNDEVVVCAEKA